MHKSRDSSLLKSSNSSCNSSVVSISTSSSLNICQWEEGVITFSPNVCWTCFCKDLRSDDDEMDNCLLDLRSVDK